MSTIHLALVVLAMCVVGGFMALTLVSIMERREDGDA
jgi:hypothetical protein